MEEFKELRQRLSEQRPVEWESFPDIGLYMDQIISYMPRQLIHYGEGDLLTSAMVNNYIKDGLLPRAEGKRYSRIHLAYLTAICVLKQVLTVKEAKRLIATGTRRKRDTEELYAYFCRQLSAALTETADSRTIWGKTFRLVRCASCGAVLGTREELELAARRAGQETETLCERCRKAAIARTLAGVYGD